MAVHIAIVHKRYGQQILSGDKTVEARLSRVRCAPFGRVCMGERIYFKQVSGQFFATAVVASVDQHEALTPRCVARLSREYHSSVRGTKEYWQGKKQARYATFVVLKEIEQVDCGPIWSRTPGSRQAWFVLDDDADVYPACVIDL